ncbi:Hypothetical protein NGAL_HAMBI2427_02320 [Neorhizobium galegae bv. orientalis]|uniref:Uncharacterized protein n=1 Tax=Neorhizobium galegae bv. orientalis str. HAMBI 540 TaxID=1028800 RepID=A0A068SWR2_NEOGA|nr:Hypothetical protein RG540_PA00480 [Neorhizobium galegae bv. orientalis str. HAMBI 540]CDZ43599.1 Hypothetical protein NGAL_HAMBI2427_02320 [Neorhizobium galegae bv. orientalis]
MISKRNVRDSRTNNCVKSVEIGIRAWLSRIGSLLRMASSETEKGPEMGRFDEFAGVLAGYFRTMKPSFSKNGAALADFR